MMTRWCRSVWMDLDVPSESPVSLAFMSVSDERREGERERGKEEGDETGRKRRRDSGHEIVYIRF